MITRTTCRDCGGLGFETVLHLGDLKISTFPDPGATGLPSAPLHLVQCTRPTCGLVQLAHTVDPDLLFRQYWYLSGINETMRAELADVVSQALTYRLPRVGEAVMDVGANDGTLLRYFSGADRIAIDPADTVQADLHRHAEIVRQAFFPDPAITRQFAGQIAILTSIACFYTADDPHAFVEAVRQLLAPDGVWILQFQDLAQMLAATAFDNVCHEHLTYLSLRAVEHLIARHELEVVHAERRAINGGSLRLIVRHKGVGLVSTTVGDCRKLEDGCHDWETLAKFSWRVDQAAKQVRACVAAARKGGHLVDLYGASTKGNTLLQVAGLGPTNIRQAWERSPAKWGRETVTGIPIVSEEDGRADPPEMLLCGIWQFREAVLQREAAYLGDGGVITFPLPAVDIVTEVRTC